MAKEIKRWITVNGTHVPIYENNNDRYEDTFDIESMGDLDPEGDVQDFIQNNLSNPAFKQYGRDYGMDAIQQLQYTVQHHKAMKEGMHETKIEDAIQQVRDNIKASHISGWFREGDSDYKPRIAEQLLANPETLNAAYNIAYENYKNDINVKNPLPFEKWLYTPQIMYRGTSGQSNVESDVFSAWTPDKRVAENFATGRGSAAGSHHGGEGKIHSMRIRPIDTWGSLQTTGEQEFMVPVKMDSFQPIRRKR